MTSPILQRLSRLLAYDRWANQEVLRGLEATPNPPAQALRFFAHLVAAEWLWLSRIKQDGRRIVVWPELSAAECESHCRIVEDEWRGYFASLTEECLQRTVPYQNSKGEPFENTVEDIMTHILLHSAYHRGQIATAMRAAGLTPAYTDYIEGVRRHSL